MRLLQLTAILLAGLTAACAPMTRIMAPSAQSATSDAEAPPAAEVRITRDGDLWTADYVLERDAPVWAFIRSSLTHTTREPWRVRQWQVTTPGVVLERVGTLDILRATDGGNVPRNISLRLTPTAEDLEADYATLMFTDGSVALYSGAFDVFPLPSVEAARTAPDDLDGVDIPVGTVRIAWRDTAGPVLLHGDRMDEGLSQDDSAYVLFGQARMKQTERLVTVLDPELPGWISAAIEDYAPRVIGYYGERLGAGQSDRPTIMASWRGPTAGMTGFSGGVLAGLIVMSFEGEPMLESSDAVLDHSRWFISHEGAHFWLGQTVRYERSRDAWITEGGADLMAALATKALVPTYDLGAELQREVDECTALADQPVTGAGARGQHKAYYACGAVFALVAQAAQARHDGGDWFDFLRPLIDANREDGVLTRAEWLDHLDAVSGDPTLRARIETFLDTDTPDPVTALADLLHAAGISHRVAEGRVVLAE